MTSLRSKKPAPRYPQSRSRHSYMERANVPPRKNHALWQRARLD